MVSPTGVFVLSLESQMSNGREAYIFSNWPVVSIRRYQYAAVIHNEVVPDTSALHEDILYAILLGVFVLAAIAVMESESRKYKSIPVLPFHSKREKENISKLNTNQVSLKKNLAQKSCPKEKNELLAALDLSRKAEPIDIGNISQVYKLFDAEGKPIAIFKPYDEILNSTNSLALSTADHCRNEIISYQIDLLEEAEFRAGVPETRHVKLPLRLFDNESSGVIRGSLQRFESNTESAEDYGTGVFETSDVHKIGILDLKILNCDRHSGNLLLVPNSKQLIPIDHALAFPEIELNKPSSEVSFAIDASEVKLVLKNISFDWLLFPQAKVPFSSEHLLLIKAMDIRKHLRLLSKVGMNMRQRLAVFASLTLLREAAIGQKKTLFEIGCLVQRQGRRNELSTLEVLVHQTVSKCDKLKLEKNDPSEIQTFCRIYEEEVHNFFKV